MALVIVALFAIGWLTFSGTEVGMANAIELRGGRLSRNNDAATPQSVIDDAHELARQTVGDSQDKLRNLAGQLLTTYREARNTDVVVFFNSGGWGWNLFDKTPGWESIIGGIKSELHALGYRTLVLNYQRTSKGLRGCIREFFGELTHQSSKAAELARRIEFLTDRIPNLRVLIAGESTGTIISDKTMTILPENSRVYCIQTGTPFWYKPLSQVRTLLMNSNGQAVDTFSYGKISTMIWATVRGWFGLMPPEENRGTILTWLRAPGHDYSWQYPGVSSEVIKFLKNNFEARKS